MSRVRRAMAGMARRLPAMGLGFGALAALVRLTVRDLVPGFSTLYYATPPAVLGVLILACGVGWIARRRWKLGGLCLGLAALFGLWQVGGSRFANGPPPDPSSATVRVLLWNLSGGSGGWNRIAAELSRHEADVACFVEAGRRTPERECFWERVYPGRDRRWLEGEMLVVTQGRVESVSTSKLGSGGRAGVVRFSLRGRERNLVVVDILSNPLRSRREAFERLGQLCGDLRPDIVLGDFNTPRDSALLGELREGYVHAFEAAGNGFDGTWPMPLPILPLDHVWCSRPIRPVSCRLIGSGASDHRAVVAELREE